ncbi:MAG: TraB/GumN family protein [Thermodesulfobacteriota bacterium]
MSMQFLRRLWEHELRMVWRFEKNGRTSFVVGTAHFFPYSFRTSLSRLLEHAQVALFEGPLDEGNMERVRAAGVGSGNLEELLAQLDDLTIRRIADVLAPDASQRRSDIELQFFTPAPRDTVCSAMKDMKPWMAFFALYSGFLRKNGWKSSVDLEAYRIAQENDKPIVFLETIEEQVQFLESLSQKKIVDFISRINQWDSYTRRFLKWYLAGDVDKIFSNPYGFPTREPGIMDRRDTILFERMLGHMDGGDAVAFVGVPHLARLRSMFSAVGFEVSKADPP